ncbi:U6 snRNA-associated Sm protein LSm1 [Fasciola hepatica]|uniref:U6 snRNA-associated Sm-like protein LSm1 n=1 Tax=Fasciola hepatica TaxID=6192 RepID=A0A4E0RB41_FASHE|nr:U6 snRNA-associated Sm protein LSm1 [Fasciola hepatica]
MSHISSNFHFFPFGLVDSLDLLSACLLFFISDFSESMLKRTYPGSASLFQDIGKKMIIYLRDNHIYIGYLRIIDQFGNIVIHQAVERVHVGKKFCDIHRGILIIRGENIILIGEVVSS